MKRWVEQIISIPLWFLIFPFAVTITHWSMTKEDRGVKRLKKASYKEFKEKMLSSEWFFDPEHPRSLFSKEYWEGDYFHAGIIRFGDVGYLLTTYGLLRALLLQTKIAKSLPNYCKYKKPYIK